MLNFQSIRLNNKVPVYIQLSLYVKQQILLGKAVSGDELPSRREVAAQLNINPNTVQKAFKLMEEEGFVVTSGNQGSTIYVDEAVFAGIEAELTREMVCGFVKSAKEVNLSFKSVIDLLSELWDKS